VDGLVLVWDIKSQSIIAKSCAEIGSLSIAWDPVDRYIVVQSLDGKMTVYDPHLTKVREITDCLGNPDSGLITRVCWSPDGSFIGAPGYHERFTAPFFQRESFGFAFALEGHIAPVTCLAAAPFLLKADGSFCSVVASVDKRGVLAVWVIGGDPHPILILDRISSSTANDLSWSPDGRYLLVALESDPVRREGGLLCVRLIRDFEYARAEPAELDELRSRLAGDTTFHVRRNRAPALSAFDHHEREVELEIVQLTTEEVRERQRETIVDGRRTIRPVLLTPRERQIIAFSAAPVATVRQNTPHEMHLRDLGWAKAAALSAEPSHTIVLADRVIVASGITVVALDRATGRRLAAPVVIGGACKHLSAEEEDGLVLAVAGQCHIVDVATMRCVESFPCPPKFTDFKIAKAGVVMGFVRGHAWLWDSSARAWLGGAVVNTAADADIADVERLASWEQHEGAVAQWFDCGSAAIYAAFTQAPDDARQYIRTMEAHAESPAGSNALERLKTTLAKRWGLQE
jgi:protein HIRA/HIR1